MAEEPRPSSTSQSSPDTATVVEAARVAERRRMADLLHDDVLQRLLAVRQDANELSDVVPSLRLEPLRGALAELDVAIRSVARAHHDDALGQLPLEAALHLIVEDAARRGHLGSELDVSGDPLDATQERFVVRAVRELTANVVRHAAASTFSVRVVRADGQIVLEVVDDGIGTDPAALVTQAARGHLGLPGLRQRARDHGGTLEIAGGATAGTTVRLSLPAG